MRIQVNRTRGKAIFLGLAMRAGLFGSASCSSIDEATGRRRVEHLVSPGTKASPSPANVAPSSPPNLAPSSAPAATTPASSPVPEPSARAPSVGRPLSPSDHFERNTGIVLSPRDKAIMDACPARVWSKKVPARRCTRHDECGDGFCDRGRCAAIWTCDAGSGQRCESDDHCGVFFLCNLRSGVRPEVQAPPQRVRGWTSPKTGMQRSIRASALRAPPSFVNHRPHAEARGVSAMRSLNISSCRENFRRVSGTRFNVGNSPLFVPS
jgi:hypothetical protein